MDKRLNATPQPYAALVYLHAAEQVWKKRNSDPAYDMPPITIQGETPFSRFLGVIDPPELVANTPWEDTCTALCFMAAMVEAGDA